MKSLLILFLALNAHAESEDEIFKMVKDPIACHMRGETEQKNLVDSNSRKTAQALAADGLAGADFKKVVAINCNPQAAIQILKSAKAGDFDLEVFLKVNEAKCSATGVGMGDPVAVATRLKKENVPDAPFLDAYKTACDVDIAITKAKASPARKVDMDKPGGGVE